MGRTYRYRWIVAWLPRYHIEQRESLTPSNRLSCYQLFGSSEHHMPFGGTITLDYDTLLSLFRCIVNSVQRHGFNKVLILNGHGGNIDACKMMAQQLSLRQLT